MGTLPLAKGTPLYLKAISLHFCLAFGVIGASRFNRGRNVQTGVLGQMVLL